MNSAFVKNAIERKKKYLVAFILFILAISILSFSLFLRPRESESQNQNPEKQATTSRQEKEPTPSINAHYLDECIKLGPQLKAPSDYEAHVFRSAVCMPDISIEKMHMVTIVFWPKGVVPELSKVQKPLEGALKEVEDFWERELDNRVNVTSEVLPVVITGEKYAYQYTYQEIQKEIEEKLGNTSSTANIERIKKVYAADKSKVYYPSSDEFTIIVEIIMQNTADGDSEQNKPFPYAANAVIGIASVPLEKESVLNWPKSPIENVIAHEVGHTFGLPDMYETPQADKQNEWYEQDVHNIMGANINAAELEEMRLAGSVKKWIINKK